MELRKEFIIVGNGVAGMTAAEEIRKRDKDAGIRIITGEKYLTYYRVKLSHFIGKSFELKDVLIHDESWYRERDIEVIMDTKVKKIDVAQSKVMLESGEELSYDQLLLANGSSSFIPPVPGTEKTGAYALRNLYDLNEIQQHLQDCKEVAVIGGGLLGLEAAWSLKERGFIVHVLEFFPYLLPRQLDEELAGYVKEKLEEEGLKIHLSAASQELVGDGKIKGILLKDGTTIPADMVLFSTGVKPNTDIVVDTEIHFNKGIQVDEHMRTNVKNIYAAGDVAEFKGIVMGLWSTAMDQGKVAGKNMTGANESYDLPQPATLLNIGGLSVFSVGEIGGEKQILGYREGQIFHKLFMEEGKIIGGVLTGDVKKMAALKKAVNGRKDISDLLNQGLNGLEILNQL